MRAFLTRNDTFWALIGPDRTHIATCGLGKGKKNRKKDSCKLPICPDHPRRRIEVKVCMPGGLCCLVLYIKFYWNRSGCFAAVGGRKSPFPITLAIGLYKSLYYRTSREWIKLEQEVKVCRQKAPHGGPFPVRGHPRGRNLYHWIPGVGFPISVP